MKIYDHVIIFGQRVDISYSDDVADTDDAICKNNKILINPSCKNKELARVFIHEFLHMVCERVSISQGLDIETEEMIVDSMAKALTENFYLRFKNR